MFSADMTVADAVLFSRLDQQHPLSTVSSHSFQLEERLWLTAEHYYQFHKFDGLNHSYAIAAATTGLQAYHLGNRWFLRKLPHWRDQRRLWMTRALYRKTVEHQDVRAHLLDTGEAPLVEISLYDHFWGIGRDQRGNNMLGKVWMDIRSKISG